MNSKIHIGNIDSEATEHDLLRYLSEYVNVVSINFIGAHSGSVGFAFVVLDDDASAVKAVRLLDGSCFMNRALRVTLAKERSQNSYQKQSNPIVEKVILPKRKPNTVR